MRSKANIKSHPVHPILVSFPIALLTGTVVFDVLGYFLDKESFIYVAGLMEISGIIMGLVAAIPGLIDYKYTVPPDSSAKKRATKHMLINISALTLFGIAYYLRKENYSIAILVLEIAGFGIMTIAGWLGGTLVYRNQIGVDIRYADAGKWKEIRFDDNKESYEIATSDEIGINQMKLIIIKDKRYVLAKTENGFVVFDDRCTHKGGSLAGGSITCGTVQCPWHGSQFDVGNGTVKAGPAKKMIKTYSVKVRNGKIILLSDPV